MVRITIVFVAVVTGLPCSAANLLSAVSSWTNGPFVTYTGDSIAEGHNFYHSIQHTGPSGDTNYNIASVEWVLSTNVVTGTNYGHGSQTFAANLADDVIPALSTRPKYLLIHSGVVDVSTGRTWADVQTDLNSIKSLCVASNAIMVLDDIFPWTDGTSTQNNTIRTFNSGFTTWAATNNVKRIISHDSMGQVRISTGNIDDLNTAYNQDGIHITPAGYTNWAAIILTNLVSWETSLQSIAVNVTATHMSGQ